MGCRGSSQAVGTKKIKMEYTKVGCQIGVTKNKYMVIGGVPTLINVVRMGV